MATRSRIGIENEDGSVSSVYCHWDGYLEHNGVVLENHYKNRELVKKLISLGSISSLRESIECPEGHSFQNPVEGYTIVYHRDRGESLDIRIHENKEAYFSSDLEEYGYLFTLNGEWLVKSGYSNHKTSPQKVSSILNGSDVLIS